MRFVFSKNLSRSIHPNVFLKRGFYNLAEVDRLMEEHSRIITDQEVKGNLMMFL